MTLPTSPQPAAPRPPTAAGWAHTAVQLLGLVAVLSAVVVLAGWPWALGLGGLVIGGASLVTETLANRPPRPPAAPAPGGDR
jgi:hypothetical protein